MLPTVLVWTCAASTTFAGWSSGLEFGPFARTSEAFGAVFSLFVMIINGRFWLISANVAGKDAWSSTSSFRLAAFGIAVIRPGFPPGKSCA